MKRVVVFGTFDILHSGHLWFFKQAKRYGDKLIVVVACDAKVIEEKQQPVFNEKERLELVQSLRMVDRAVLGDQPGEWTMLTKLKPDVICVGYDQNPRHPALGAQIFKLKKKPRVVKIKALKTQRYSSSEIRLSL